MPVKQILVQIVISIASLLIVAVVAWAVPKISIIFSGIFVPEGAVVAFVEESCPEGWKEYRNARGRFLRGVSAPDKIEELGGNDTVTLGPDHLPRHRHSIHDTDHSETPGDPDTSDDEYGKYLENKGETGYAGKENPAPIDIVPNYVAVLYCRKD